jgi:hypothetical protein
MLISREIMRSARRSWARPRNRRRAGLLPRLEGLEARTVLSSIIVANTNDSGMGSLRDAVAKANPGDVIGFSSSIFGQTITLTSGEIDPKVPLTIEGPGADRITIDAHGQSSIFGFGIPGSFTVSGLTLQKGLSAHGGAIHGGSTASLTIKNCTFAFDTAEDLSSQTVDTEGGAIAASGPLNVDGCDFNWDVAIGSQLSTQGGNALGGAIYCDGPELSITNSHFEHCRAIGGYGPQAVGGAYGGAVEWAPRSDSAVSATPTGVITADTFSNDESANLGYAPNVGGFAGGGALDVEAGLSKGLQLTVAHSSFDQDKALGGPGVQAGVAQGGSIRLDAASSVLSTFQLHDNTYIDGQTLGGNAVPTSTGMVVGGDSLGGAIAALAGRSLFSTFTITIEQIKQTSADGGRGAAEAPGMTAPRAGDAKGGGIYYDAGTGSFAKFMVDYTLMVDDQAVGGSGGDAAPGSANDPFPNLPGDAGSASGGGLYAFADNALLPTIVMLGSEQLSCSAEGGAGGAGADATATSPASEGGLGGEAIGGGVVFDAGNATSALFEADGSTFGFDTAVGGIGGNGGKGAGFGDGAPGGQGGYAEGGALAVYQSQDSSGPSVSNPFWATVKLCNFDDSSATGGKGGFGGEGINGGVGGRGGDSDGGAIWVYSPTASPSDVVTFDGDWLLRDAAIGGLGGTGGVGDSLTGGGGGQGGDAHGGGITTYFAGTVKLLDPRIVKSKAVGGGGGASSPGAGGSGPLGISGTGYGGAVAAYSYKVGGHDYATAERHFIGNTAAISPDVDGTLGTI